MEDSNILLDTDAALQPLLEVAEDSKSSAATLRAVLLKALSHAEVFCGYDSLKAIAQTANLDDDRLLATLDLFSYGSYTEYTQNSGNYLSLNDTQVAKLRQLTLLSCVHEACRHGEPCLSYADIGQALQLNDDKRTMEQVIISCIYARVLNGRLCQKSQQLLLDTVPPCISRDVQLSRVSNLVEQLQWLGERLDSSSAQLGDSRNEVTQSLEQSAEFWKRVKERQEQTQKLAASQQPGMDTGNGNNSGNVRGPGWPESGGAQRRSSASRQSGKRSRGGLGGSFTDSYQRF